MGTALPGSPGLGHSAGSGVGTGCPPALAVVPLLFAAPVTAGEALAGVAPTSPAPPRSLGCRRGAEPPHTWGAAGPMGPAWHGGSGRRGRGGPGYLKEPACPQVSLVTI